MIDGIYGRQTRGALKSFQESASLKITGEWNEETESAIVTLLSGTGIIVIF